MKKLLAVTLSVLCVFFAFGYLGKSVEDSRRRPKSTQTEQSQEQENPTETNKYHAGAVLTFGATVVFPEQEIFNTNIRFQSNNKPSQSEIGQFYDNVDILSVSQTHIIASVEDVMNKDRGTSTVFHSPGGWFGGSPDVWTLTENLEDNEENAVLRAWLDENVTVS